MLKAKETDVQTIKLTTGEEIIAKVARTSADWLDVVRPLTLVLAEVPGNPAQTQVMFTPWMLGVAENQEISIDRSHVIATGAARDDARTQYLAATKMGE
jgi:hypothetical protein